MHVGAVLVFDAGPLRLAPRWNRHRARAGLHRRASARGAARAPEREPSWRSAGSPSSSTIRSSSSTTTCATSRCRGRATSAQLKRLVGRVFSQALDPDKPLWELWVVEGLDDDRFALIAKLDSALVEGDGRGDVLARAVRRPAATPLRGASAAARGHWRGRAREVARLEAAGAALRPRDALRASARSRRAPSAGGRRRAGPHWRIDWLALDAADVAAVSRAARRARRTTSCWRRSAGGLRRLSRSGAAAPASWRDVRA